MKHVCFTVVFLLIVYTAAVLATALWGQKHKKLELGSLSLDMMAVLKGCSILLVMVAHIGNLYGVRYLTPLGAWGVSAFLFCSGYGLYKSAAKRGVKGFWGKRLRTVYIPYAMIEIVGYLFFYDNVTMTAVAKDLLLIEPLHPLGWYMQCIFLYYVAFYISCLAGRKHGWLQMVILCAAALAMFVFMRSLFKQQVFSFVLGIAVARYSVKIKHVWMACLLFGVLGGGFLALRQIPQVRQAIWPVYYGVEALQATCLMLATVMLLEVLTGKLPEVAFWPIAVIGEAAYELYLIHMFFMPKEVSALSICVYFVGPVLLALGIHKVRKYLVSKRR